MLVWNKNSDKEKDVYSGHRVTFDVVGSWSFDNNTARNAIIFGVYNILSFHADNFKNKFLMLGEGPTFGISGNFGSPEKKFSINFSKASTKFCLSLPYNASNSYLFVNGKEILRLKPTTEMLTFQVNFVSEAYLIDLVLLSLEKHL